MTPHIAFLHTSPVHVDTFERLVRASGQAIKIEHIVAEELLADAQRLGTDYPSVVAQVQSAMNSAASTGAAIVVCTCSTIGGVAAKTPTTGQFIAARIDRAMADPAVALGPRILLVAALESTLKPTVDLIEESAFALQAEVKIQTHLVQDVWMHFSSGKREAYIDTIARSVRAVSADADVIVLA